jgi:hypothetical protein
MYTKRRSSNKQTKHGALFDLNQNGYLLIGWAQMYWYVHTMANNEKCVGFYGVTYMRTHARAWACSQKQEGGRVYSRLQLSRQPTEPPQTWHVLRIARCCRSCSSRMLLACPTPHITSSWCGLVVHVSYTHDQRIGGLAPAGAGSPACTRLALARVLRWHGTHKMD